MGNFLHAVIKIKTKKKKKKKGKKKKEKRKRKSKLFRVFILLSSSQSFVTDGQSSHQVHYQMLSHIPKGP